MSTEPNKFREILGDIVQGAVGIYGFVVGVLVSAVVTVAGGKPLRSLLLKDDRLQWEVLLTGVVALIAAWMTVRKIDEQITQDARVNEERRRRSERAARARLPLAMSEFIEYSIPCIRKLAELWNCQGQPQGSIDSTAAKRIADPWQVPDLPEDALVILKEYIEVGADDVATELVALISLSQIQHARLSERILTLRAPNLGTLVLLTNIETDLLAAAEVYGRAAGIFPYARNMASSIGKVSGKEIRTALAMADLWDFEFRYHDLDKWTPMAITVLPDQV